MIETTEAIIVYDPISTVFDVETFGGQLTQRKNTLTGEFVTDRRMCPMALIPSLAVTDPNAGNATTDETARLLVGWYQVATAGGEETETEISTDDTEQPYYKDGNTLIVQTNIEPGSTVVLRAKAQYVSPTTLETLHFRKDFVLSTQAYVEFNPTMEIDIPNYTIVSPFELTDDAPVAADNNYLRTVMARYFAGSIDISDNAKMVYIWEKLDGTSYRAFTDTDIEVVSSSGRTLVLDLRCIGRCKYRCTAYYDEAPYNRAEFRRTMLFTVNRQASGYTLKPRVTNGKYLRKDTPSSEAEAVLTVNSSEVGNPSKYFYIKWLFYLQSGTAKENTTTLGTGNTATASRELSGYNRNKIPTFQMEYGALTEYRLVTMSDSDRRIVVLSDDDPRPVIAQGIEE